MMIDLRALISAAAFAIVTMAGAIPPVIAQSPWTDADWNPAGTSPSLILPLPCDGGIALTRVETPTEKNWLSDLPIRLGSPRSDLPHVDFIWSDNVSGALTDAASPTSRHYYIGTYEITKRQLTAVLTRDCQKVETEPPGAPVETASWFEAIRFVEAMNAWLLEEKPEVLHALGSGDAFVRLPTEAEWEFAARGGGMVPDAETFRAPMFPMDAPLERYAHHLGRVSCNGSVRPIGLTRPNPLGLYDIVGNVSELVHDPFRLNANGRLHGQAGGFIARGGSCYTPRELVSTASREELPVIDRFSGGIFRGDFTGFRIVVTGVALPEDVPTDKFIDDFNDLSAFASHARTDAVIGQILTQVAGDEKAQRLVEALAADYRAEIARRERVMRRSIRSSIVSAAFMARSYLIDSRARDRLLPRCNLPSDLSERQRATWKAACDQAKSLDQRRMLTRSLYGDLLARLVDDLSVEEIEAQLPEARKAVTPSKLADDFARLFVCQLADYADAPPSNLDAYFLAIELRDLSGCS